MCLYLFHTYSTQYLLYCTGTPYVRVRISKIICPVQAGWPIFPGQPGLIAAFAGPEAPVKNFLGCSPVLYCVKIIGSMMGGPPVSSANL